MADYRVLVRLAPTDLPNALWQLSPPLSRAHRARWVLVMLDIAVTDSYPVNKESGIDHATRIHFASHLLDFLDRELEMPSWNHIAHEYVIFARKAIEDGVEDVPANLRADHLVRRVLDCFPLTRTQALELAMKERERYHGALTAGLEGEEFRHAVRVEGDADLFTIRNLLSDVCWFQGKVADADLAAELDAWLSICSDLELGEDIAELLGDRIRRTRENP